MENKNLPKHVAIIPDGNRRWAKENNCPPWVGHYQGAKTLERLLRETILPRGIKHFSLWIASYDNLKKRPEEEVKKLCELFADYFTTLVEHRDIHKYGVKVSAFGELADLFPSNVVTAVKAAEKKTAKYSDFFLNFFMAYDGLREILNAVDKAAEARKNDNGAKLTENDLKSFLWTKDLPPVDLLIRTGVRGDPHFSGGFMMWQTMYSQLYFSEKYFPDFGPEELKKAMEDYSRRERRFGG